MLILESFKEWKKINEVLVWTKDTKSRDIALVFKREFLPTISKIGANWKNLTYREYNKIITSLTTEDLKNVIDFFSKKGYTQPHAGIKKMQEDIMSYIDVKTFQNAEDQSKPFNDGIFGIATAKALLDLDSKRISKYFINARRGDFVMAKNVTKEKTNYDNVKIGAVSKSDSTNVKTGVKKQTLNK